MKMTPKLNTMWRFSVLCCFITIAVGFFAEPPAAARPSIRVEPSLTVGGRWESNFYRTESDEQAVYTYLVSPGISAELRGARLNVTVSYNMEAHYYDEAEDAPTVPGGGQRSLNQLDYTGHQVALASSYNLTSRLTLGLNGGYYETRYPTYYDRLSTQIWHRKYDIYRVMPLIYYDITRRLTAGLRYQHTEIDLGSQDTLDPVELDADNTTSDIWMLNVSWTPRRSVTVDLDLAQTALDYDDRIDDYDAQQIGLKIQKRFRQIALDAGVGFESRDYQAAGIEDQDLFTWRLAFTAQAPQPTARPHSLGNVYMRPVDHVYFALERQFNTMGDLFTATRFTGSIGSMWGQKLESRLKGWYQISDYENSVGYTPEGDEADPGT